MSPVRDWRDIDPSEAVDIVLPRDDIRGPYADDGTPCPWPWEPQQLVGVPLGMYHCPYCGSMVMAGMPHVDYDPNDPGPAECKHCHEMIYYEQGSWYTDAETRDGNTGELLERVRVFDCGFLHDKTHEPKEQ